MTKKKTFEVIEGNGHLEKALKESVRHPRRKTTIPLDMPEGVRLDKEGNFVLPKTIAERADLLYRTQQLRLDLQRRCQRLEKLEGELEQYFVDTLPKSNATGIAGEIARVQIKPRPVPIVENWDKFYAYVLKHKAFDMLQRRLSEKAANERIEVGDAAKAGLSIFHAKKVSVTKL